MRNYEQNLAYSMTDLSSSSHYKSAREKIEITRKDFPSKNVIEKSPAETLTPCVKLYNHVSPETNATYKLCEPNVFYDDCNLHHSDCVTVFERKFDLSSPQINDKFTHDLEKNSFQKEKLSETFLSSSCTSKSHLYPDHNIKGNLESEVITPNVTGKNVSNILGKMFNKKPNVATTESSASHFSSQYHKQNSIDEEASFSDSKDTSHPQVKTKLKSIWNNMKYGWRMKREVNLKTDSAIWLLGQCYHSKLNDGSAITQDVSEQLRLDLMSKIWLTYRINFPTIPGTNLISDSGWGCMLRCAQMMMAQAFVCHFLQRNWRLSCNQSEANSQLYKMILRWFGDSLSEKSPFSLHRLVSLGESYGRKAGDWYGPSHAAHVLRDALVEAKKTNLLLQDLCMYVASDGIVFKQDVLDLFIDPSVREENQMSSLVSDFEHISWTEVQDSACQEEFKEDTSLSMAQTNMHPQEMNEGPKSFENLCPSYSAYGPPSYSTVKPHSNSLILFVSVRLGNDKLNPFYIPCLKSLLAYEHCIGIIGGRPKHALYFIGYQDDKLIHMDPHSCQPAIDVEREDFSEKSFHSASIRTMSFSEMDPSCSIGFYFRKQEDFQLFVEKFSEITAPLKRNLEYPVFALAEGKRVEVENNVEHSNDKCIYASITNSFCEDDDDDDDYILL